MHLSVDLSKYKGINTFITTNYYITSTDGNLLRKELKENTTPLRFLNFNELKLFSTALGQHNMITLFQKGKVQNKIVETFYTSQKGRATQYILTNLFSKKDSKTEYYNLNQEDVFEGDEYYIRTRGTSGGNNLLFNIFSVLENGTELGEICDVRQGLRTGADKISNIHLNKFKYEGIKGEGVFILSLAEVKKLGYEGPNEVIKPLYKNSDIIKYYSKEFTDQYILYIDNEIELQTLKTQYPTIYEHLLGYKELICKIRGNNNENSVNWFRLDRPREQYLFEGEKICVPQRSNDNRFGYNIGDWYASADVYFIKTRNDDFKLKYLLALLNSKLFYLWFYYKGKRKGEMLELYQKPLSEAPVLFSEKQCFYEKFIDYILFIKSEKSNNIEFKLIEAYFEQIIDGMVYELYFPNLLKEHNRNIIEYLGELPEFTDSTSNNEKEKIINTVFKRLDDKDHPVRNNLFYMRNIEEIATIEALKE
jgi:adenine-specific DNA-methyltransferase